MPIGLEFHSAPEHEHVPPLREPDNRGNIHACSRISNLKREEYNYVRN